MPNKPQIGIFWSYKNKIFHIEGSNLEDGIETSVSRDYAIGHYNAWFVMAKNGVLDKLPKSMQDEYDSIPRGRVVYLFEKKKFVIYHGDEFTQAEKEEIIKAFNLPKNETIDDIDMHYNPLPEDFEF